MKQLIRRELYSHNLLYSIVIFALLFVIIIVIFGGYIYQFFYKTIRADFFSTNMQYLTGIIDYHENDMEIIDNIVYQIRMSDDETMFKLEKQPLKANALKKHLKRYKSVSNFFDLLLYYYHEDVYFYNHATSMSVDNFWKSGSRFERTTKEDFIEKISYEGADMQILQEQHFSGEWIEQYISSNETVIIIKTVPPQYKETLLYFVPSDYYDGLLTGGEEEERTDFLCYDGQIIVRRGNVNILDKKILELITENSVQDSVECNNVVQKPVQIDKNSFLLTLKNGDSGIVYGTIQPMVVFYDKIWDEQWSIIILLLICVFPVSVVFVVVSRRIVHDVRMLNRLLGDSSNSNLKSIEDGIQSLIYTQGNYEKENILFKKIQFIRNFVQGVYTCKSDAVEQANQADLNVDYELYLLVLIQNRENNRECKVFSSILELIREDKKVEGYGIHLINNNQSLFVLLGNKQEDIEAILLKMHEIQKAACMEFIMSISNYHSDFGESTQAYLEVEAALDSHLLKDNSRILSFADIAQENNIHFCPDNYIQDLKYAIYKEDKTAIREAVAYICNWLSNENTSLYALRVMINDVIHALILESKRENIHHYDVFALTSCFNIEEFSDLLCDICMCIVDNRCGKNNSTSLIVKQAIDYMHEHYREVDLNMNQLAEYLMISPGTLSIKFREEKAIRPSDYLANLRMENAKKLLTTTKKSVVEIGNEVGYSDKNVFLRRFKKSTGMTPTEYRSWWIRK